MDVRIKLIQHALLGAYTQNLRGRVGAFLILNRLFTLFFRPVGFAIYQAKGNGGYKFVYQTFQEPLYIRQIIDELNFESLDVEPKKVMHRVYSTAFYISVFEINKKENASLEFRWIDNELSEENRAINKLFAIPNDGEEYFPYENIIDINSALANIFMSLYKVDVYHDNVVSLRTRLISEKERYNFIMRAIGGVKKNIIDKEYRKIWNSPLISPSQKNPSNIFFFFRTYTRDSKRFEQYKYDVRLMIPPSQKQDMEMAFETIAQSCDQAYWKEFNSKRRSVCMDIRPKDSCWYFMIKRKEVDDERYSVTYRLLKSRKPERNQRYINYDCDEEFWEMIQSENGRREILEGLETKFGDTSRSMSDTVFSSGMPGIELSPFQGGGMERISAEEIGKGFDSNEVRRLVGIHYLFSAMSPKSNDLVILLVPIFLAGSVWFVTGIITDKEVPKKNKIIDDVTWNRFYHFYYDISVRISRNIRSSAKQQYLTEVYRTVYENVFNIYMAVYDGENINLHQAFMRVSELLGLLGRVYPYEIVVLELDMDGSRELDDKSEREMTAYLNSRIIVRLEGNKQYPKLMIAQFIRIEKVFDRVIKAFEDVCTNIFSSPLSDKRESS